MKRHEGKTMLVTGAAGAIGFATCRILAEEGARVMLVDIDDDRLQARTAELKQAGMTSWRSTPTAPMKRKSKPT